MFGYLFTTAEKEDNEDMKDRTLFWKFPSGGRYITPTKNNINSKWNFAETVSGYIVHAFKCQSQYKWAASKLETFRIFSNNEEDNSYEHA